MADIVALKAEIDTDPLTRGYAGMTDAQVADDVNTFYRNGPADPGALFSYCVQNKARDDSAATPTNLLGRLMRLASATDADIGTEFFLDDGTAGPSRNLQIEGADAGRTFLQIVLQDRATAFQEDLGDQALQDILEDIRLTGLWKPADVTAITALSENKRTRAQELNLGRVREATVTAARAL